MLSLKYIRIRKDRPVEERLASIWQAACSEFGIPCILIYLDQEAAYISVNLRHLALPEEKLNSKELQKQLETIQLKYAGTLEGFWKHHDGYYTFDMIHRPFAQEAATGIFKTLCKEEL